jgi:hypothetical protein
MIIATVLFSMSTAALADNSGEQTPAASRSPWHANGNGRDQRPPCVRAIPAGPARERRPQRQSGGQDPRDLARRGRAKRDKALKQIQKEIGAEPGLCKTPAAGAGITSPADTEGPAYVREFYAAQVAEYQEAIVLFERYLRAPDNIALSAFAREQLPIL